MKAALLLFVLVSAIGLSGCGSPAPLPDTSMVKKKMPPGWKPKDVLLPINK